MEELVSVSYMEAAGYIAFYLANSNQDYDRRCMKHAAPLHIFSILISYTHLIQFTGSSEQSVSQRNCSQASQPTMKQIKKVEVSINHIKTTEDHSSDITVF